MEPIRVLVLTTTYPAHDEDGTPAFVADLAHALAGRFDISVVCPRVPGAAASSSRNGVSVERFPYFPQRWEGVATGAIMANLRKDRWRLGEVPSLLASYAYHAGRHVSRQRPHVIHAHWSLPAGLIAVELGRRHRIPVVVTCHGADLHVLRGRLLDRLQARVLRRADVVSTVSAELAAVAEDLGANGPVPIVRMGVDFDAVREAVGTRHPTPGSVLYVGRLAQKKGVDVLLDAAARTDVSVRIIGDGPLRPDLEDQARRLGLRDRVHFLGQSGRTTVFEEMARAAALVVPSVTGADGDKEGTPVVVAEAVAAGVPVIASRLGGMAEVLDDDTAVLVPPADPETLAQALSRTADPAALGALADAAATGSPRRELDLLHTAAAYARMYHDVC